MKHRFFVFLALVALASAGTPAAAQPSAELVASGDRLIALLRGETQPAELFTATFLQQVPAAQVTAITDQLRAQYGAVQQVERIEAQSATAGVAYVAYERATLRFSLAIEPVPPYRVQQLLVVGSDLRGDTLARVTDEFRALPGRASLAIARLGDGAPAPAASHEAGRPMAIGSTFKLFILAELARSIGAGERRWSDVVSLDRRSLPSGIMQDWPAGAPVTLHTLAALMISRSDNTATDILLHVVGRESVERLMPALGVRAAERNRPFLSTLEMFALKTAPDALLRAWLSGSEAERRRITTRDLAAASAASIDATRLVAAPTRIETLEWFASTEDLVRTMDWLRRNGDDETLAILSISPGVGGVNRQDFLYLGYKGGSEPGVINLTWLVRSRGGEWFAVSGTWNDPAAPVDEARFVALMQRALNLVR